jgi:hypothetical protein
LWWEHRDDHDHAGSPGRHDPHDDPHHAEAPTDHPPVDDDVDVHNAAHDDDEQHDHDEHPDECLGRWQWQRRNVAQWRFRWQQRRYRERLGREQRRQAVGRLLPRQLLRLARGGFYFLPLGTKYAQ